MDRQKIIFSILQVFTWLLILLSIVIFYISLRTKFYALEYSLAALGLWALAFLTNFLVKKYTGRSTLKIKK